MTTPTGSALISFKSCKSCLERHVNCHSTCENYKAYKAEYERRKKNANADLEAREYFGRIKAKRMDQAVKREQSRMNRKRRKSTR